VLALFPLAKLARDGNTEPEPSTAGIRFTIGVQVDSAEEVDRLTGQMRAAGARVTNEPVDAEFFAGRSAYLCDPEGNYFEIAWADMPNNPVVIATPGPPAPEHQRPSQVLLRKHGPPAGDAATRMEPPTSATVGPSNLDIARRMSG
jgi:hypothetical protein